MSVTKEQVIDQLKTIEGPTPGVDIVEEGLVSEVFISGAKVMFSLTVPAELAEQLEPLRLAAQEAVTKIDGVESAMVALTAERKAGTAPKPAAPSNGKTRGKAAGKDTMPTTPGIPGIKTIIAVASGKGGVGKSTTAINLALGMQNLGLKVGVLDADIYGPSMPRLLGITDRPDPNDEVLKPMMGYGLKVMSMGFLVEEDTAMIWRGPMVMSALTQMMREVEWGELDLLVVDMPPGTGDAQLTMAQQVPLAGAIIVSTPQDLALIDARKGLNMFKKVEVPIIGIIENMSTFICPKCGEQSNIFGHGGAEKEAERLGTPFLGAIPLHMDIRETSDDGKPVVASDPDGPHAGIYQSIAVKVSARLEELSAASTNDGGLKLVIE